MALEYMKTLRADVQAKIGRSAAAKPALTEWAQ
jgi:hypothetical protein